MRFLILNTDYPEFLRWLYHQHPGLEDQPYDEQMRVRTDSLFGVADFYSRNLRMLGHEAYDIHANNGHMQTAWAQDHGLGTAPAWRWEFRLRRGLVPWISRVRDQMSYAILAAQIERHKPDVLLNQAVDSISTRFLKELKDSIRLLVGQIASPLPSNEDFNTYDLIISSLPNFVAHFRKIGIRSELNRFAFEPTILERFGPRETDLPITFVGSLSPAHQTRLDLLERLSSHLEIDVWGIGADGLPPESPIRHRHRGTAWGIQMYQILHRSKLTLNHHIGISDTYANNMRLYEATGVGTLLITDWKENLPELFDLGKEVVAYRDPDECLELIRYYLEHEDERQEIARAGQQRTLRDHTYCHRMQELVDIVRQYL
jgi:hypothetical protein